MLSPWTWAQFLTHLLRSYSPAEVFLNDMHDLQQGLVSDFTHGSANSESVIASATLKNAVEVTLCTLETCVADVQLETHDLKLSTSSLSKADSNSTKNVVFQHISRECVACCWETVSLHGIRICSQSQRILCHSISPLYNYGQMLCSSAHESDSGQAYPAPHTLFTACAPSACLSYSAIDLVNLLFSCCVMHAAHQHLILPTGGQHHGRIECSRPDWARNERPQDGGEPV